MKIYIGIGGLIKRTGNKINQLHEIKSINMFKDNTLKVFISFILVRVTMNSFRIAFSCDLLTHVYNLFPLPPLLIRNATRSFSASTLFLKKLL